MIQQMDTADFFTRFFRRLNLVDGLNFGYFTIIGLLMLIRHHTIPQWGLLFAFNTGWCLVIATLVWFTKKDSPPLLVFCRYFYTVAAIALMYKETEFFMRIYHDHWLDPLITRFEISIFHTNPYFLLERISKPALNEYAKFAYSTYFFFLAFMPLYLFFVKKRKGFYHYLFTICVALFTGYLLYPLFPVEGPRYFWGPAIEGKHYVFPLVRDTVAAFHIPQMKGFVFNHLVGNIMKNMESTGGCMPSTHVSASLVILFFIGRYIKPVFPAALPLIISVCLATVYNRYHYISDMVAGTVLALIAIGIGALVFRKEREFIRL
jgi:membrane-associated phospholipid phosphatase